MANTDSSPTPKAVHWLLIVLVVQSLRLLAMIIAAPAVVAWLVRSEERRGIPSEIAEREAETAMAPR